MTQPDYSLPAAPPLPPMGSGPAPHAQLQRLHRLLAERLLEYVEKTPIAKLRASTLAVARAFLQDNAIAKDGGSIADMKQGLESLTLGDLPFDVKH